MRNGIDCRGREWHEIELHGRMNDIAGKRFGKLIPMFPVKSNGVG